MYKIIKICYYSYASNRIQMKNKPKKMFFVLIKNKCRIITI